MTRKLVLSASFFDEARAAPIREATPATLRIQSLSRITRSMPSGEHAWSPAIAGQAARSMHAGFGP